MSYSRFTVEDFVLDKYFRKWVLSPDEESNLFWQGWLQRNPDRIAMLQEARAIILRMPRINYGWNDELENSIWKSIVQSTKENPQVKDAANTKVIPLNAETVLGTSANPSQRKKWDYQKFSRVAATVLLLLSIGIAGYLGFHESERGEKAIAFLTKEAPLGTKVRFDLSDGTQVILNAGSTARYPERFSSNERVIEIKGEAYLDVAKDSLRPFRVRTNEVITEALGTAFNVRNEQNKVEIALVEGKVQVSLAKPDTVSTLILHPGEQASLHRGRHLSKQGFDTEKVIAWKDNIIFFEGTSEEEVIRQLERWYGVKITMIGQSSKPWDYTGKFKDKGLSYVLKSIGYTMGFQYVIDGKEVKIMYTN
ncbi:FecR domain-containing protein [Catalinimonas sp. 4WD22]|uniref:FecR family protein n=1 Tax=Catalinimonas locisalis TaxID=3133978 RepID=UPI0031016546